MGQIELIISKKHFKGMSYDKLSRKQQLKFDKLMNEEIGAEQKKARKFKKLLLG
jgi:hypothetical protein